MSFRMPSYLVFLFGLFLHGCIAVCQGVGWQHEGGRVLMFRTFSTRACCCAFFLVEFRQDIRRFLTSMMLVVFFKDNSAVSDPCVFIQSFCYLPHLHIDIFAFLISALLDLCLLSMADEFLSAVVFWKFSGLLYACSTKVCCVFICSQILTALLPVNLNL